MPRKKPKGSFWSSGKWQGIGALATVIAALISVLAVVGLPWGAESPLPIPAPPAIPAAPVTPALLGTAVGSISGYVKDAQGQPILGASVDATAYEGGGKAGETKWHAETDGSGYYQIKNIPAGIYRVFAWSPKHVRMHWENTILRDNATPISVAVPTDTANINFKLEPGGTISGSVKDITTGQPLVNVSVTALRVDGEGRSRTTTDQNGNYTISGLPFGQYQVSSPIGDGWGSGDDGYITEDYKEKKAVISDSADLVTITVQNPDTTGIHFGLRD